MSSGLLKLPTEVLLRIPEYLDPGSFDMLAQTCKELRELFSTDNLSWRTVSQNVRIGRPDRSRSRSRSRSVRRERDTFATIGRRAASEERGRGRKGPINWKMDYSSEEDSASTIEEIDPEMASMQVEHPEEAGDSVRPLRDSSRSLRHTSNSRSRSRSRSRVRTARAHPALSALWFNRAGTTVDSVEVILPDTDQREKLVDHPQTYYCLATEPPLRKVELQVGDHVSRVENDEGITVCDVVDETLNTINYIIINAAVSDDGEMDPATTLVLDGRLKRIQYVEPETLECIFEL